MIPGLVKTSRRCGGLVDMWIRRCYALNVAIAPHRNCRNTASVLRLNPTLRSIGVLLSLLIVCLIGVIILRASLRPSIIIGGKAPDVQINWDMPAADADQISFSASGEQICTMSDDGLLKCYDRAGAEVFSATIPGANRAIISPDGECTLVYAHRNPENKQLAFIDDKGEICWRMNVASAIWSADADSDKTNAVFAVGTGEKRIYVVSVGKQAKRFRRFKSSGVACSMTLDASEDKIVYGTWQPSSIRAVNMHGRLIWENERDAASLQFVESPGNSDRILLRSTPNRAGSDGEATLYEEDGKSLRRFTLSASESTNIMISPNGVFLCAGYSKMIEHAGKSMPQRHAALYDYFGRRMWDKGSMLLQVTPLLVNDSGFVLISDGKTTLFVVAPDGAIKQACELPSLLVRFVASQDRSQALAECADGRIYHLKIR